MLAIIAVPLVQDQAVINASLVQQISSLKTDLELLNVEKILKLTLRMK